MPVARAYSIMPFVWCLGLARLASFSSIHKANNTCRSILGPALGGALAQPVQNYPTLFDKGSLFGTYPFLLPNLVCVVILGCGVFTGTLFLKETHAQYKHREDPGLICGHWLLRKLQLLLGLDVAVERSDPRNLGEQEKLLSLSQSPVYGCSESRISRPNAAENAADIAAARSAPIGAQKAFTRSVLMYIVAYGVVA